MATLRARARVGAPIERVFAFFDDPRNLATLVPPPARLEVLRVAPEPLRPGTEIEFSYGIGRWRRRWLIRIVERVEPRLIRDETLSGPFVRFRHEHRLRPAKRGGTWIEDAIDFHVGPGGVLGALLDGVAWLAMRATFVYRHAVQRRLLRSSPDG